ncbi:MAG: hypothetical protein K2M36_03810, partial [Clostridia bacterium]|nr:hypothetical protein [Clostridia bacterium]
NKIGTLDKAQLNAYTLGTRDLYSKLTLKSSAKSASVASIAAAASVASEEVIVNSEEKLTSAIVEENAVRITETAQIETVEIVVETNKEANENCKENGNNSSEKVSIILVDTRRVKVNF